MEYTKLPEHFRNEYREIFNHRKKNYPPDQINWKSFMCWCRDSLNIKVRHYQGFAVKMILSSKDRRAALCWGRQLGKSTVLGLFCLWTTNFNFYPATINKKTNWYIMSRDDKTAQELIEKIRNIIRDNESYFYPAYNQDSFINNTHRITLPNGCFIQGVPPTSTILGKSGNVIIDEFAKLKILSPMTDVKLLHEFVEPVTSETDGWLIISSTPNGQAGEFYEIFDPADKNKDNIYVRIWYPYYIYREKSYLKFINRRKKDMKNSGQLRLWQQEYMAMFTVTQESFFETLDIERAVDKNFTMLYDYHKTPCVLGIDYGMTTSRYVLTITSETEKEIRLIYQFRSEANFDDNLLTDSRFQDSVVNLFTRYNIIKIIADDCLDGETLITIIEDGTYKARKISDCKSGDLVLSYDFNKNQYCHKLIEKHILKGMLPSYRISLRNGCSIIASSDHEWFTANNFDGEILVQKTEELNFKGSYKCKSRLTNIVEIPDLFNNKQKFPLEFYYLIGMYISEGHHHPGEGRFFIHQMKKIYKDKIRICLKKLGYKFSESKNGKTFTILSGCRDTKYFLEAGDNGETMRIPSWLFSQPKKCLEILWEALFDGDGYRAKSHKDRRGFNTSSIETYYSVNGNLANDVKFLGLLLGKPMCSRKRIHSGFNSTKMQYSPSYCANSVFKRKYIEGISLVSVKDVSHVGYSQMYDIKVQDTESFVLWESGVITHNCPSGTTTNNKLTRMGYPVELFNFRSDQMVSDMNRNRGYYMFKTALRQGRIKYPEIPILLMEMRNLIETQNKINIVIKAPDGYLCDTIDSFMMSCIPFLRDENEFQSMLISPTNENRKLEYNPWIDKEWEQLQGR